MSLAHHRGVVHLDLKPGNILFDDESRLVICDWGLSRVRCLVESNQATCNTTFVTITHRSPELLLKTPVYSMADDVWSLGIVMIELLTEQPFVRTPLCGYE